MRSVCFSIAAVVLAVFVNVGVQAQQPARPAGAAPASAAAATPQGGGRIAVIDSSAFSAEQGGIGRVVNAIKTVDAQFTPQRTELQGMQERYTALIADIQKTAPVAAPAATAQKQEQADQLKVQIQRKAEDAQAAYQRRLGEVLGPLQEDVYNTLQSFAQQRGITLIIDISRTPTPVLYAADTMDITQEFITEYNRAKPATAAATPTPAATPTTRRP